VGSRAGLDVCGKFRPPPGFDPRTVQPVSSRYTDRLSRPAVFDIKSAIDSVFSEPQNGGYPRDHINGKSLKPTMLPEMLA